MDMSNVIIADLVVDGIDVETINRNIAIRAEDLAHEMPPDAAAQFLKDMSAYQLSVTYSGNEVRGNVQVSQSYFLDYLKAHGTPVSGGDGGTAHNLDGSTYTSKVDPDMQGTPLPWYELPIIDGQDEAFHVVEIQFPDAVKASLARCSDKIGERVTPVIAQELPNMLGGGS